MLRSLPERENSPTKNFLTQSKTNKLKTFTSMNKKRKETSDGRTVILKADRSLFGRMIVMAQARDIELQEVLANPLGPLPWALSTPDGSFRTTKEAAISAALQKNARLAYSIPSNADVVIGGMALVQKIYANHLTFADVADNLLSMALQAGAPCKRVDVVFDQYREQSINSERLLRGEEIGHRLRNITSSQIVRQWCNFLSVENKPSLIRFIVEQ